MNMLAVRTAQAELAASLWDVLVRQQGRELARSVLSEAVVADAIQAGQAFARTAPGEPSLAHFATVLDRWREGGALEIGEVCLTGTSLSFAVTTCRYARTYAEMGLDPELGRILSCSRDASFAGGYSRKLAMNRSRTIMDGASACLFSFTWND